jgi:hypothetical protein
MNFGRQRSSCSAEELRLCLEIEGTTIPIEDVRTVLIAQTEVIHEHLGAGAQALLDKWARVWT